MPGPKVRGPWNPQPFCDQSVVFRDVAVKLGELSRSYVLIVIHICHHIETTVSCLALAYEDLQSHPGARYNFGQRSGRRGSQSTDFLFVLPLGVERRIKSFSTAAGRRVIAVVLSLKSDWLAEERQCPQLK
jgi:hypothetical protein